MAFKLTTCLPENVLWLQWFAAFAMFLISFVNGLSGGWSSPYIAQLTAEHSKPHVSLEEASYITSLYILGRLFGAIIGALGYVYIGGKKAIMASGFLMLVSWALHIVPDSVILLIVARVISGVCFGMFVNCFPLFLGEVASPEIRGAMVSFSLIGMFFGVIVGNVMGCYLSISGFAYATIVLNVIYLVLLPWIPESPHYLVRIERIDGATKAITKYNPKADANAEVESLRDFVKSSSSITFADKFRELMVPRNRKAMTVVFFLQLFTQLSAMNAISFYMEMILHNAKLTIIAPSKMVVIVNACGIPSLCGAIFLVDKFGRKTLMVVSYVGVFVGLLALGAHFKILEAGYDPKTLQWLPIISLISFSIFGCIGLNVVPSVVFSELFAPSIKGLASCLGTITSGFFGYVIMQTHQTSVSVIGEAYVLWIYAANLIFAIIFVLTVMPETKGKTLQQIQEILAK